ncbi:MAG: DUF6265 family protein [Bacteroidota bacterium]
MIRRLVVCLALAALVSPAAAQEALTEHTLARTDTLAKPPATLDDVSWLVGSWHGPGLGGDTDEIWLPPVGGAMPGMFRLAQDGAPVFYEIWAMREVEGTLVLELKHFNPDITSWEERDEVVRFHLVRMEPEAAYFSGMTYRLVDPDTLQIWVAIRDGNDVSEASFTLRRQPIAL